MDDRIRVLYVDDRSPLENRGDILAEEHGFVVRTAASVPQAKAILEDGVVDCVLSNVEMPGEDEMELFEYVSAEHPAVPFIFGTAHERVDIARAAFATGTVDFIPESLGNMSDDLVADRISRAVEHASISREIESHITIPSADKVDAANSETCSTRAESKDRDERRFVPAAVGPAIEAIFDEPGRWEDQSSMDADPRAVDRPITDTMNARYLRRVRGGEAETPGAGQGSPRADDKRAVARHSTDDDGLLLATVMDVLAGTPEDVPDLTTLITAVDTGGDTALDTTPSTEETASALVALLESEEPDRERSIDERSDVSTTVSDQSGSELAVVDTLVSAVSQAEAAPVSPDERTETDDTEEIDPTRPESTEFSVEELLERTSRYDDAGPSTDREDERPTDVAGFASSSKAADEGSSSESDSTPVSDAKADLFGDIDDNENSVRDSTPGTGREHTPTSSRHDAQTAAGVTGASSSPDGERAAPSEAAGHNQTAADRPLVTGTEPTAHPPEDAQSDTGVANGSVEESITDRMTGERQSDARSGSMAGEQIVERFTADPPSSDDRSTMADPPEEARGKQAAIEESSTGQVTDDRLDDANLETSAVAGLADLPKEELVRILERLVQDRDVPTAPSDDPDDRPEPSASEDARESKGVIDESSRPPASDAPTDQIETDEAEPVVDSPDPHVVIEDDRLPTVSPSEEATDWEHGGPYHRPDALTMTPGTSVLVECRTQDERKRQACTDLLCEYHPGVEYALLVQYRELDPDRISQLADLVPNLHIVAIGYHQPVPSAYEDEVHVLSINNPNDLTRLGIVITGILDGWAETTGGRTCCFDSLNVPLQYQSVQSLFRFLHILLGKLREADIVAHFHVDPTSGDRREINVLTPLFDEVLSIDASGTHLE